MLGAIVIVSVLLLRGHLLVAKRLQNGRMGVARLQRRSQQEEKSTRNSSCWKPQYCRYRPTDSVYHHLSVLTVDIHSRQSGGLVPQSVCLC